MIRYFVPCLLDNVTRTTQPGKVITVDYVLMFVLARETRISLGIQTDYAIHVPTRYYLVSGVMV